MPRNPDRYVIRELTGYPITPSARKSGARTPGTDVYVFDSWDGFQIVAAYKSNDGNGLGRHKLDERRKAARAQCDALNEEHRRWLHSGRWGSKVPAMQAASNGDAAQTREGTGSR